MSRKKKYDITDLLCRFFALVFDKNERHKMIAEGDKYMGPSFGTGGPSVQELFNARFDTKNNKEPAFIEMYIEYMCDYCYHEVLGLGGTGIPDMMKWYLCQVFDLFSEEVDSTSGYPKSPAEAKGLAPAYYLDSSKIEKVFGIDEKSMYSHDVKKSGPFLSLLYIIYTFDEKHVTDYGFSIFASHLTGKGKTMMEIFKKWLEFNPPEDDT